MELSTLLFSLKTRPAVLRGKAVQFSLKADFIHSNRISSTVAKVMFSHSAITGIIEIRTNTAIKNTGIAIVASTRYDPFRLPFFVFLIEFIFFPIHIQLILQSGVIVLKKKTVIVQISAVDLYKIHYS